MVRIIVDILHDAVTIVLQVCQQMLDMFWVGMLLRRVVQIDLSTERVGLFRDFPTQMPINGRNIIFCMLLTCDDLQQLRRTPVGQIVAQIILGCTRDDGRIRIVKTKV